MSELDRREPADAWGEHRGSCQNGPGKEAPEAVLLVHGAEDGNVSLVATSQAFRPALYVRSECGSSDNDSQLGCEDSSESNGPFASVEGLREVQGVGDKLYDQIAPLVTVGG